MLTSARLVRTICHIAPMALATPALRGGLTQRVTQFRPTPHLQSRRSTLHAPPHASRTAASAMKRKIEYQCPECGQMHLQLQGKCRGCGERVSMIEIEQAKGRPSTDAYVGLIKSAASSSSGAPQASRSSWINESAGIPRSIPDILLDKSYGQEKVALPGKTGKEISRVLGGGYVPGSVVLIAGEPGIGKSTLLMQLAALVAHPQLDHDALQERGRLPQQSTEPEDGSHEQLAEACEDKEAYLQEGGPDLVLYVSAEEGEKQVADRANRLGLGTCDRLLLMSATNLDHIISIIYTMRPTAVIVDSIQQVHLDRIESSAGSPTQVRESTSMLKRVAADVKAVIFIVGHVTKAGDVAGPKTVEHAVDTVLNLHGDRLSPYRLLRTTKNRYGSPSEVGIFNMVENGMVAVENPSEAFLSERIGQEPGIGSAVGCFIRGNRPIMLELQALVTRRTQEDGQQGPCQRLFLGVDRNNAAKVVEILQKHVKIFLGGANIFISVVADQEIKDVSGDLVMALALASSASGTPLPADLCAVGEVDLAGRLRQVRETQQVDRLVAEAVRMGFSRIILPAASVKGKQQALQQQFKGQIQILPCRTVKEAVGAALGGAHMSS